MVEEIRTEMWTGDHVDCVSCRYLWKTFCVQPLNYYYIPRKLVVTSWISLLDLCCVNFVALGPLPSEPVKAICSALPTQQAAYDLLVALSTGCVGNLEELCHLQEELFYKGGSLSHSQLPQLFSRFFFICLRYSCFVLDFFDGFNYLFKRRVP